MPSHVLVDTPHVKGPILRAGDTDEALASPQCRHVHLFALLGRGLGTGLVRWLQIYCWSVLVGVVLAKVPASQQWPKERRKMWLAIVTACGMYLTSWSAGG